MRIPQRLDMATRPRQYAPEPMAGIGLISSMRRRRGSRQLIVHRGIIIVIIPLRNKKAKIMAATTKPEHRDLLRQDAKKQL